MMSAGEGHLILIDISASVWLCATVYCRYEYRYASEYEYTSRSLQTVQKSLKIERADITPANNLR